MNRECEITNFSFENRFNSLAIEKKPEKSHIDLQFTGYKIAFR